MPENWTPRPLSGLGRYVNGFAFKPHHWVKEGLPIVRIEQLNNPSGEYDFCSNFVPTDNIIDDGDLIFSWSATLKVALWRHGRAALNQHLFKVIPNAGTDKGFLFQLLDHHMDSLAAGSHGSTMKHIKRSELDKYIVKVPGRREQTLLARILSTLDSQIETTERLIAKQQRIRAGLMQDLFTRGVDEHGQLRPPHDQAPHAYHQTELGWLPLGWVVVQIRDLVVAANSGCSVNSLGRPAFSDEAGILKTSCVGKGMFWPHENKAVEPDEYQRLREPAVPGSIIVSRMNTPDLVGESGLVAAVVAGLFLPDRLWQLHVKPSVSSYWLSRLFQFPDVKERIKALATGTSGTMKNIEKAKFLSLAIPRPTNGEMQQAQGLMAPMENYQLTLESSLNKLRLQKSGLMQDLLTGTVSVGPLLETQLESVAA
jgi:type I restriction enzyme, S subunit